MTRVRYLTIVSLLLGFVLFLLLMFLSAQFAVVQTTLCRLLGVRHLEDIGRFFVGSFLLSEAAAFVLAAVVAVLRPGFGLKRGSPPER